MLKLLTILTAVALVALVSTLARWVLTDDEPKPKKWRY